MKQSAIILAVISLVLHGCKYERKPVAEDPCLATAQMIIDGIRFQKTYEKILAKANTDCYGPGCRPMILEDLSKRFAASDHAMLFCGVQDPCHWEVMRYKFKSRWLSDTTSIVRETIVIPLNHEPADVPTEHYIIIEFDPSKSTSEFINFQMLDSNQIIEKKLEIKELQESV